MVVFALSMLAPLGSAHPASAYEAGSVNDFVITDFSAEEWLDASDRQGRLRIVEHINTDFAGNNHGILRAIPQVYNHRPLQLHVNAVSSSSGAPTHYSKYVSSGNTVLKIGDPSRTVTGLQEYTIDYTVQNVMTFYDDHDELYWDINGDQWEQPVKSARVQLHLPSNARLNKQACYAGSYGSGAQECTINVTAGVMRASAQDLSPAQTLTIVAGFDKGYFAPPSFVDWLQENGWQIAGVVLPIATIGGYAFRLWFKYGRDPKDRGVIVPEYEQPDGLGAAEVASVYKFSVSQQAISATIIDLAIRGYIRIHETEEKKLLAKGTKYSFERQKTDYTALRPYEKQILNGLFDVGGDATVELASLKNKFYKVSQKIQQDIPNALAARGYFAGKPLQTGLRLYIIGSVSFFAALIIRSWWSIGFIGAAVLSFFFGFFMSRRTEQGVVALEKIKGLKLYLQTAEKDRIAMLQSPNAPYAKKSDAPIKTVELFERLLPFAIVLGVENEWANQFESIYTTPPDWYSGNWTAFNATYLATSLHGSMQAMNTNFAAPSSSSGSGFGGGGFSGGGGGGGGGGGW